MFDAIWRRAPLLEDPNLSSKSGIKSFGSSENFDSAFKNPALHSNATHILPSERIPSNASWLLSRYLGNGRNWFFPFAAAAKVSMMYVSNKRLHKRNKASRSVSCYSV